MAGKPTYEELEQRVRQLEQVEIDRKRSEEHIRFLSSAVEQSSEGMAIADTEGNLIYVNQAWVEMHGYESSEELVGRNLSIFHNPDQLINEVETFNSIVMKNGYCKGEVWHIRKDGKPFPTLMTTTLLKDESGNPTAFSGIAKDITDVKRAEEQRDKLISDLQKTLSEVKTLRGFLPICSHCKKIRDDKGYWNQIEAYIQDHSGAEFSHGICQECAKKYYPEMDIYDEDQTQQ
jgi:PAS domain S-box-containing protein